ncbi:MAG: hypothetical protein EXR08_04715 [Alphaproteobacteria bacterium]|nr:hypothetical protein [Alphaproteobacteria bacterium]
MFNNISPNFMRNPLGIIALFIVMIYAMAGLVTTSEALSPDERFILVIFLAAFPLIVLVAFYLLVTRHSEKLYAPGDFKDEENYLRAHGKASGDPIVKVKPDDETKRVHDVAISVSTTPEVEIRPVRPTTRRITEWIKQAERNNHPLAIGWLHRQGIQMSPTTFALIEPDEKLMKMIKDLNIPEDGG